MSRAAPVKLYDLDFDKHPITQVLKNIQKCMIAYLKAYEKINRLVLKSR